MSIVGKKPIEIPEGVKVEIKDEKIEVTGPKGLLDFSLSNELSVEVTDGKVVVKKIKDQNNAAAMWGTTNRIIGNMIKGVTEGFQKQLELNGVGFRMAVKGKKLDLALGFSHPVEVDIPEGIDVVIENTILTVSGIDKHKVGQFAANIRALKPVEPYKGKGFKYVDEIVRRKEGKKAVAAAS